MKIKEYNKKGKIFLIAIIISIFVIFFLIIYLIYSYSNETRGTKDEDCFLLEEQEVIGSSMGGIIESGENVSILFGYYNCNEIKRGDIILYNYSGNKNPIIKIVKAVPGDKFYLEKSDNYWNIFVNGEKLLNSFGEPYSLNDNTYKMLALYEKDYNRVVPENSYLILGNLVSGSLDSTNFGFVHKNGIIGKVKTEGI